MCARAPASVACTSPGTVDEWSVSVLFLGVHATLGKCVVGAMHGLPQRVRLSSCGCLQPLQGSLFVLTGLSGKGRVFLSSCRKLVSRRQHVCIAWVPFPLLWFVGVGHRAPVRGESRGAMDSMKVE